MRRKDREITDKNRINDAIDSCKVCRLAMWDGEKPYIVPLNFGYTFDDSGLTVYFHSATAGRKLDILKKYPYVCFEMDSEGGLAENDNPCEYGYNFQSVIGEGEVEFIEEPEDKACALNMIMRHLANREYAFTEQMTRNVCVYKIKAKEFACKIRESK